MELPKTRSERETRARRDKEISRFQAHEEFGKKLAAQAIAITVLFVVAYVTFTLVQASDFLTPETIRNFGNQAGVWGPLAIIAIVSFTSFSIPTPSSPVIIVAGAIFGPVKATAYALIGVLIGSSVAFWIARLFRKPIIKMLGDHAEVLTRFQERYVFNVLLVTRIFPVISFEIMSYAAGLTALRYGQYVLATLAAAGSIFMFATLGSAGATAALTHPSPLTGIVFALTLVAMLFIIPIAIDHYNPFGWKEKLLSKK